MPSPFGLSMEAVRGRNTYAVVTRPANNVMSRVVAPRREAVVFAGAVAVLWLVFAIQAWNTPVLLDDWYQLTWHRNHAFGLGSL